MKRAMDLGHLLLTGLNRARGEISLAVLAHNLKEVINIVGVRHLLDVLT